MKYRRGISRILPALALAFALAAGCEQANGRKTRVFRCSEGMVVTVVFSEKDEKATMRLGGRTYKLKHVPSSSGAKYSDGKVVFWNKGDEALIEINGEMVHDGCRLVH